MLICGQFIAKDLNIWSTLLFVHFEKLNFSNFWGPLNLLGSSKKSQLLDSWPLSMPLKTRPWMNLFKNIVLYLIFQKSSWKVMIKNIKRYRGALLVWFQLVGFPVKSGLKSALNSTESSIYCGFSAFSVSQTMIGKKSLMFGWWRCIPKYQL